MCWTNAAYWELFSAISKNSQRLSTTIESETIEHQHDLVCTEALSRKRLVRFSKTTGRESQRMWYYRGSGAFVQLTPDSATCAVGPSAKLAPVLAIDTSIDGRGGVRVCTVGSERVSDHECHIPYSESSTTIRTSTKGMAKIASTVTENTSAICSVSAVPTVSWSESSVAIALNWADS